MSLVTRLQREVKTNPAKAAGLGVLLLVACYFWAPLLLGFMKPAENSDPAPSAAATAAPATTAPTVAPPGQGPQVAAADALVYDWRKYAQLVEEDAKMRPSAELPSERDPFASPLGAAPAESEQPVAPPVAAAEPITPAEAGLVLTTTLLGARKKIAEIDGKSYAVGDRVEVLTEALKTSFRVVEIYPRRVVLESHGKRYELKLPRPLLDTVTKAAESERASRDADSDSDSTTGAETAEQETGAEASNEEANVDAAN